MIKRRIRSSRSRGAALITVLLIAALLTLVVLAMLATSNDQRLSSDSQETVVKLQAMRDSAINIAISQLRDATTQADEHWASQPGAIRTFANQAGEPRQIFKLYSDERMVENFDLANANLETDLVADWDSEPHIYADLNAPKTDSDGNRSFPIVDPRAFDGLQEGSDTPEGFSYTDSINGVTMPTSGATDTQRLPMPVKWIYKLRDGSLGTLDESLNFTPFDGTTTATASNPITGRFAFWTDDESGKVNINTASEAIYWDTPRCYTPEDLSYADQQPVNNEVQRYGGHPATTCLSSVFFPGDYLDIDDDARLRTLYDVSPRVHYDGGILADTHTRVNPDPDRLYVSVDDMIYGSDTTTGGGGGVERALQLDDVSLERKRFFLTANSSAPEVNPEGKPKISLWPVFFDEDDAQHRTSYDNIVQFLTTIGGEPYSFQRSGNRTFGGDWTDGYGEDGTGPNSNQGGGDTESTDENQDLLLYYNRTLGYQSSSATPGYGNNFYEKYRGHNMAVSSLSFFDFIKLSNMRDDTLIDSSGSGSLDTRVTQYSASRRTVEDGIEHYSSGTVEANAIADRWFNPRGTSNAGPEILDFLEDNSLDDLGFYTLGRRHSFSELAFVFIGVVERTASGYNPPLAELDPEVSGFENAIVDSSHPLYLEEDEMLVQIAFIPELTNPGVGYPHPIPETSIGVQRQVCQLRLNDQRARGTDGNEILENIGLTNIAFPEADNTTFPTQNEFKLLQGGGFGGVSDYRLFCNPDSGDRDPDPATGYSGNAILGYFVVPRDSETMEIRTTADFRCGHNQVFLRSGSYRIWGNRIPTASIPTPRISSDPDLQGTWRQRIEQFNEFFTSSTSGDLPDIISDDDVIRSFISSHSDDRLSAFSTDIGLEGGQRNFTPENFFAPLTDWSTPERHVHSLYKNGKPLDIEGTGLPWVTPLVDGVDYDADARPHFVINPRRSAYASTTLDSAQIDEEVAKFAKIIAPTVNENRFGQENSPYANLYSIDPSVTRDWDTGPGAFMDGGFINMPDPGTHTQSGARPYFDDLNNPDGARFDNSITASGSGLSGPEITKPNHMIPSAGVFGSIPSLPTELVPWTTYLFRPEINTTNTKHIGASGRSREDNGSNAFGEATRESYPPDHMLMEYFWMPIIEPYAISEPFATAGKIGMNYRMAPFSHINRATGLHAVLKSERMLAIPTSAGTTYKNPSSVNSNDNWRNPIDSEKTLLQWEERFDDGNFFQSPSEVCEMFLVPQGEASSASNAEDVRRVMRVFWDNHLLTGDNVLERPYTNVYPRLTTKSNAYSVHYLSQTIKQGRRENYNQFSDRLDVVVGEDQGQALIERFIDPNDDELDEEEYQFLTNNDSEKLDDLYQYRIRYIRRFTQ